MGNREQRGEKKKRKCQKMAEKIETVEREKGKERERQRIQLVEFRRLS